MNIFAKVILTTDNDIKDEIISRLSLALKEKNSNFEVYSKLEVDANIVLIFSKNKDFEEVMKYIKENYETIKFLNISTALAFDDLDIKFWDIVIPNTFINKENEAVFLEYLVDKNYDLKNFWLILNWICLTLEKDIKDEEELQKIRENSSSEIFDFEAFYIAKILEKNDLLDKSSIVKIIWKEKDFIKNWINILEIML